MNLPLHRTLTTCLSLVICMLASQLYSKSSDAASSNTPNVIFFVMDDLNDWISPLGYDQAITPNMDRLAGYGVNFTNAHAPGVFCAPSRTALWTGLHATRTGCYDNEIFFYDHPDLKTLQMAFNEAGYKTYGAGKLYHHRSGYVDLRGWTQYFARSQEVIDMAYEMNSYHQDDVPLPDPFPYSPYYRETGREPNRHLEWGPIDNEKEDEMAAAIRTKWICDLLGREHEDPFFMAVGMYIPHYPNYAPQKYFDLYDKDSLELPLYKEDDLADLPPAIQQRMLNRKDQHDELKELGVLKDALQAWLAATTFADALLGRILDALEASPYMDNTVIVFWSDQGFHHGEKFHWGKHTLWQRTSQVPFIWAGPGIARNGEVDATVSLIDTYPTLAELCNLPVDRHMDGVSLATVLKDPSTATDRTVLLPHADRGSYALINSNWRYIHYNDGTEELYNVKEDPHEWYNLASNEKYASIIKEMKKSAPAVFAPYATPRNSLDLVVEGNTFHWEPKAE